jgi:hypothetical protein
LADTGFSFLGESWPFIALPPPAIPLLRKKSALLAKKGRAQSVAIGDRLTVN